MKEQRFQIHGTTRNAGWYTLIVDTETSQPVVTLVRPDRAGGDNPFAADDAHDALAQIVVDALNRETENCRRPWWT